MAGRISIGGFPPEAAEQIAEQILNAPREQTLRTIQDLLDEYIRHHSRDEHGEPDPKVVSLWLNELTMRATIYHLATARASQTRFGRWDFNMGRACGARGALIGMIKRLLVRL